MEIAAEQGKQEEQGVLPNRRSPTLRHTTEEQQKAQADGGRPKVVNGKHHVERKNPLNGQQQPQSGDGEE